MTRYDWCSKCGHKHEVGGRCEPEYIPDIGFVYQGPAPVKRTPTPSRSSGSVPWQGVAGAFMGIAIAGTLVTLLLPAIGSAAGRVVAAILIFVFVTPTAAGVAIFSLFAMFPSRGG